MSTKSSVTPIKNTSSSSQPRPAFKRPLSQNQLYLRTIIFSALVFGAYYSYTYWQGLPNPLNKSVADTSVLLMSLSMLLSSICYFWNFLDSKIVYRKQLGLIGFAYGVVHVGLSYGAVQRLFVPATWSTSAIYPLATAGVATIIFAIMAAISNSFMASRLGIMWRYILRTGYIAMFLILLHVYFLKSKYWIPWIQGGFKTLPSLGFLSAVLIVVVLVMRMVLFFAARKKEA